MLNAIHMEETVRVFQRQIYRAAKANPTRKFGVLYDKIYRDDVLEFAWWLVKENRGSAGVDHQSIENIIQYGERKLLQEIKEKLKDKSYQPKAVLRVLIDKDNGKKRPLGIPTIKDRIVQTAAKLIIEPIFEADFADCSYGFRPKRSAHDAIREIYQYLRFGCRWVIDADLKSYFDTIPHDKLILLVKQRVTDKSVIKLLKLWLSAGVLSEGSITRNMIGTPQGGVISPLLANIYLNALDQLWVKQGYAGRKHDAHLIRYADDFVILCKNEPERYFDIAKERLARLSLTINEEKSRIVNATESFDFLGHTFIVAPSLKTGKLNSYHYPSDKSMMKIKAKVKEIIRKGQHMELPDVIRLLNPILRGWGNYFKIGNSKERFHEIDLYVVFNLTIMLRKKYQKRGKGWSEHPPSFYHQNHKLISLRAMTTVIASDDKRYGRK